MSLTERSGAAQAGGEVGVDRQCLLRVVIRVGETHLQGALGSDRRRRSNNVELPDGQLGEDRVEISVHPLDGQAEAARHLVDEVRVESDHIPRIVEVFERREWDIGSNRQHAVSLRETLGGGGGSGGGGRRAFGGVCVVISACSYHEGKDDHEPQQPAYTHVPYSLVWLKTRGLPRGLKVTCSTGRRFGSRSVFAFREPVAGKPNAEGVS